MSREPKKKEPEVLDLGNIGEEPLKVSLPDDVTLAFDPSELSRMDLMSFLRDPAGGREILSPLMKESVRNSSAPRPRNVFDILDNDSQKEIMNEDCLLILQEAAHLGVGADGATEIPAGLVPQNWNGNTYQGSASIMLQLKMSTRKDWTPVFCSSNQMRDFGAQKLLSAEGTGVIHKNLDTCKRSRHIVWNISDLDYKTKHPRHYAAIQTACSDIRDKAAESTVSALTQGDPKGRGVEAIVREIVRNTDTYGKQPRFNRTDISDRERDLLKGLTEDLATMSICSRLGERSHVRLQWMKSVNMRFFKTQYPFYEAFRRAGQIVCDINRTLALFSERTLDVDRVVRRTNREIAQEKKNREEQIGKGRGI